MSNLSDEVWLKIPDADDYEVSSYGRVRNTQTCRILKPTLNRGGYVCHRVGGKNSKRTIRPHRCVAMLFVPNPECKPQVNHIDGVKSNNAAYNLEWATNSENQKHANATGLRVSPKGQKSPRFERAVDVFKDGEYIITLSGNVEMKAFGVDFRNVSACILGNRHSHKGYTFKISKEN